RMAPAAGLEQVAATAADDLARHPHRALTRSRLLESAQALFAAKGFGGDLAGIRTLVWKRER
ncbi:MAG: hypothetical protein ACOC1U_03670, partial [Spirochaetota bacterium]